MKSILTTCFIIFALATHAQDSLSAKQAVNTPTTAPKKFSHEIGFNGTYLIKQAFSLSSTNLTTLPYQVTYKLITKNKLAGRVGLGINSHTENSTVSGSSTPRETKTFGFNARLGIEKQKVLGRRFVGYAGFDFVSSMSNSKTTTNTQDNTGSGFSQSVETNDKRNGFGGGPVLGLQYYFTRRVSIYTELPITFIAGSSNESVITKTTTSTGTGTVTNSQIDITNSTFYDFSITLPVTLYIAVKF